MQFKFENCNILGAQVLEVIDSGTPKERLEAMEKLVRDPIMYGVEIKESEQSLTYLMARKDLAIKEQQLVNLQADEKVKLAQAKQLEKDIENDAGGGYSTDDRFNDFRKLLANRSEQLIKEAKQKADDD